MPITPKGQAAMQARQPLQVSDWITTVSNSVRMMAPVGQTSRQGALTQCLQTSLIISQRPSLPVLAELLDEFDVPPVGPVQPAGVVVAVAAHLVLAAAGGGQLVPLLARHLAGLAADADGGVGSRSPSGSDSDPQSAPASPAAVPARHHAFSTLHTNALPSWIVTLGSPTSAVSVFTTSPVTTPSQPQCQGMPTWCTTLSSQPERPHAGG